MSMNIHKFIERRKMERNFLRSNQMNKKPYTQNEYEKTESKLKKLRLSIKEKKMTKDEAIQFMVSSMHYGQVRATTIVTEWTKHFCNSINVKHYNPKPVMKIISSMEPKKSETDLGIEKEMI